MPTTLKFRRGTDIQNSAFVGAESEITYDTVRQTIRVHDGVTAGGKTLATREWVTSVFPVGRYTGDVLGSIYADDSTLMIDAIAGEIVGPINSARILGDHYGSVFAKDSTLLVNADSGTVPGSVISGAVATATFAATANIANNVVTQPGGNATALRYIPFVVNADGAANLQTDTAGLTFLPSTNTLTTGIVKSRLDGEVRDSTGTTTVISAEGYVVGSRIQGQVRADFVGSVFGDDSTVIVDAVRGELYGNLTGNVTGNVTGVASDANRINPIPTGASTATQYLLFTTAQSGQLPPRTAGQLNYTPSTGTLRSREFRGDLVGSVFGPDSTVLVDSANGRLSGRFAGDVYGSVFADDSTMLINADDGYVSGEVRNLRVVTQIIEDSATLATGSINLSSGIAITSTGGVTLDGAAGATVSIGTAGTSGDVYIGRTGQFVRFSGTVAGNFRGNVKGTLAGDDSTILIDGVQSKIVGPVESETVTATSYLQTAVYADSVARDAAITAPQAGQIVFVTNLLKFQGYTGSGWVDFN